ncbi:MAG: ABC transporter substrate-binding protein [Lachnospiraceae bacterium]|jgi:NitT/TauT family transport system substrate-binding protein|nr:ABC transporter substrate-binding protein [Lachnospiraceae bacterium]
MKKVFILCIAVLFIFTGCGKEQEENKNIEDEVVILNIAYQYGLAYAPLIVAQNQGLIEKAYKNITGKDVTVVWNQMSSGADINTGIASGSLDVGFMGIAPAITGVTKGVGYKIFTNLSGQEHCLMTNNINITSFDDLIGSKYQIALVNVGSFQHIILAKALYNSGYDSHILDSNIVAMKHPDGMTALESGSIACHLTSSPYIYMERANENLYEIKAVTETWKKENSFIVGVASENLYNNNEKLYQALCDAIKDAIDYLNNNMEETAKLTCEFNGNNVEDELEYLQQGSYTIETKGIFEFASFMAETGFIDQALESYSDLVFENVIGN